MDNRKGYRKGIKEAIIKSKSLTEFPEEKQKDIGRDMEEKILSDNFWDDIHPRITSAARSRYESLHYADAVEAALREVNNCVK